MRMIIIYNRLLSPILATRKLSMTQAVPENTCEKIVLADSMGLRLIYCKDCNVVELEIGAVTLRLCPDVV